MEAKRLRNLRRVIPWLAVLSAGSLLLFLSETLRVDFFEPFLGDANEAILWANVVTMSGLVLGFSGLFGTIATIDRRGE
jgi:hypothetical protein